ncbi:hypothetical protein [Nonomuraea sp. SYSU D8015]|uniref:hypothetical protein n=1 Tax=Nonomuraea sp. SYSU D8015 TaxID=2593644 RepID=UPI0016610887|nr:hypothetical protein [Nonomuraea sp. SYSU D8015]
MATAVGLVASHLACWTCGSSIGSPVASLVSTHRNSRLIEPLKRWSFAVALTVNHSTDRL